MALPPKHDVLLRGREETADATDGSSGGGLTPVIAGCHREQAAPRVERKWRRRVFGMGRG